MSEPRVVIITGAGKGLGRAFAHDIARRGSKVLVNNRIREGAEDSASAVVAEIEAEGGAAAADTHDVAAPGAGEAIVKTAIDAFGRLDAVVFNAAVNGPAARFAETDATVFEEVLDVNFLAPVRLAEAAWPHLAASGAGRMLFVSSSAGLYGVRGRAPYAASKGALNALALSLAAEGARAGIGVNVLMPYAATRMTDGLVDADQAALLAPGKVAPLASRLAAAEHEGSGEIWITGGGYVRKAGARESEGALFPPNGGGFDDWVRRSGTALDLAGPAEAPFAGAEAAFAGLLTRLSAAHKS